MSDKKQEQLGMNPSTASGRLVKDLLWNFIVRCDEDSCSKCGEKMSRETFSVEHVRPWLDSENPLERFFDLENITFSHLDCNVKAARRRKAVCPSKRTYGRGCRCEPCRALEAQRAKKRD